MVEYKVSQTNQFEVVEVESHPLEPRCSSNHNSKDNINQDRIPKTVWLILSYTLFTSFSYFSLKSYVYLYLRSAYGLKTEEIRLQRSILSVIVYICPILGAIFSDSLFGKRTTILQLSAIYLIGFTLLSIFSVSGLLMPFGKFPVWSYTLPSVLIAICYGGLKPCMYSFGGDQVNQNQPEIMDKYFAWVSTIPSIAYALTLFIPVIYLSYFQCFGSRCYLIEFGVHAIVFVIGLIILLFGYRQYRTVPSQKKFIPLEFVKMIVLAVKNKSKASVAERDSKGHWLKFAQEDCSSDLVEELRLFGKVFTMLLPLIFYHVLSEQSYTEWELQGEKMGGQMFISLQSTFGFINIQLILSIFLTLTFSYWFYPYLQKKGINTSLIARLNWGYLIMLIAFLISIFVQYAVDANYTPTEKPNKSFSNPSNDCKNCLNMAWQLPQWLLSTLSVSVVSPAILQFAYTQVGTKLKTSSIALCLILSELSGYFILAIEMTVASIADAPSRQWVYFVLCFVFFAIFSYLSKKWFVSREDEHGSYKDVNHTVAS